MASCDPATLEQNITLQATTTSHDTLLTSTASTSKRDLTEALNDMSLSTQRPNFPLPREIRDQIYGYLLDNKYTRISRRLDLSGTTNFNDECHRKGILAYHFHTNILAFNHAIHDEAEELLYKRNTFVVVSYQTPDCDTLIESMLWVPIVSSTHVARMRLHSLRVHIDPDQGEFKALRESGEAISTRSHIILADGLKAFCFVLQRSASRCGGAAVTITTDRGPLHEVGMVGLDLRGFKEIPSRLRCELRDTKYRTMDCELQQRILPPLALIMSRSQRVTFTGSICDQREIDALRQTMSPSLACTNAMFWSAYVNCDLAKSLADETLPHDHLEFVITLYRLVAEKISVVVCGAALATASMTHRDLVVTTQLFHLETLINIACGELKMGKIDRFNEIANGIFNEFLKTARWPKEGPWSMPKGLKAYFESVFLWWHLYGEKKAAFKTADAVNCFAKSIEQGPHPAHDYEAAKQHEIPIMTRDDLLSRAMEHCPLAVPGNFLLQNHRGLEAAGSSERMARH